MGNQGRVCVCVRGGYSRARENVLLTLTRSPSAPINHLPTSKKVNLHLYAATVRGLRVASLASRACLAGFLRQRGTNEGGPR